MISSFFVINYVVIKHLIRLSSLLSKLNQKIFIIIEQDTFTIIMFTQEEFLHLLYFHVELSYSTFFGIPTRRHHTILATWWYMKFVIFEKRTTAYVDFCQSYSTCYIKLFKYSYIYYDAHINWLKWFIRFCNHDHLSYFTGIMRNTILGAYHSWCNTSDPK